MKKIFLTKFGMWVVSVKANDLHAIWWSDLKTSVLFADFLVKIGIFSKLYVIFKAQITLFFKCMYAVNFMSSVSPSPRPISENVSTFLICL